MGLNSLTGNHNKKVYHGFFARCCKFPTAAVDGQPALVTLRRQDRYGNSSHLQECDFESDGVQVLVGSAQKQLEAGSMALMAAYTPIASGMLLVLVPIFEPVGFSEPTPETLLGFPYTPQVRDASAGPLWFGCSDPKNDVIVISLPSASQMRLSGKCRQYRSLFKLKARLDTSSSSLSAVIGNQKWIPHTTRYLLEESVTL